MIFFSSSSAQALAAASAGTTCNRAAGEEMECIQQTRNRAVGFPSPGGAEFTATTFSVSIASINCEPEICPSVDPGAQIMTSPTYHLWHFTFSPDNPRAEWLARIAAKSQATENKERKWFWSFSGLKIFMWPQKDHVSAKWGWKEREKHWGGIERISPLIGSISSVQLD